MPETKNTFNMRDLGHRVAEEFSLTNQDGLSLVRYIFDQLAKELVAGNQVRLHKFATLESRSRAPFSARNPLTGDRLAVPGKRVLKVSVSQKLKDDLNAEPSA